MKSKWTEKRVANSLHALTDEKNKTRPNQPRVSPSLFSNFRSTAVVICLQMNQRQKKRKEKGMKNQLDSYDQRASSMILIFFSFGFTDKEKIFFVKLSLNQTKVVLLITHEK
jgi:hypothetical protein